MQVSVMLNSLTTLLHRCYAMLVPVHYFGKKKLFLPLKRTFIFIFCCHFFRFISKPVVIFFQMKRTLNLKYKKIVICIPLTSDDDNSFFKELYTFFFFSQIIKILCINAPNGENIKQRHWLLFNYQDCLILVFKLPFSNLLSQLKYNILFVCLQYQIFQIY